MQLAGVCILTKAPLPSLSLHCSSPSTSRGDTSGSAALPTATVTLLLVQAVPLYLSEMAPPQLRGGLNIMFQMATTIGARQDSLLARHACCACWPKPGRPACIS